MKLAIFSDDLTGASGVASMANGRRAITINYESISSIDPEKFDIVSINLNIRDSSPEYAQKLMDEVMSLFFHEKIALRVDSTLRGNMPVMVKSIIASRKALITDTIPEYNRFTENGYTIFSGVKKSIAKALELSSCNSETSNIEISDSRTYYDLDALAEICIKNNLVPIDPGPMIARYAIKLGIAPANSQRSDKTAIVIGTYREVTENQVRFLEERGFHFRKPMAHSRNLLDLYRFRLESDYEMIDEAFIEHLSGYRTIILSGGATADYILRKSGFMYIENQKSIMPLVSFGTIIGGRFDGMNIVLKGGLIGSDSCYIDILKYIGVLND